MASVFSVSRRYVAFKWLLYFQLVDDKRYSKSWVPRVGHINDYLFRFQKLSSFQMASVFSQSVDDMLSNGFCIFSQYMICFQMDSVFSVSRRYAFKWLLYFQSVYDMLSNGFCIFSQYMICFKWILYFQSVDDMVSNGFCIFSQYMICFQMDSVFSVSRRYAFKWLLYFSVSRRYAFKRLLYFQSVDDMLSNGFCIFSQ